MKRKIGPRIIPHEAIQYGSDRIPPPTIVQIRLNPELAFDPFLMFELYGVAKNSRSDALEALSLAVKASGRVSGESSKCFSMR
jgi:hypothetical protein